MPDRESARLFLALWPDPAVRAQLCAYRDAWRWPATVKPVPDANLHLTLHFIGDFGRDRIGDLEDALASLPLAPLVARMGQPEMWRGGIAVLRADASEPLLSLHDGLGRVLSGLGVVLDERPFSPHVTLARKAWHGRPPAEPPPFEWPATGFALVESVRGARAVYTVLRTFDAAAAQARSVFDSG